MAVKPRFFEAAGGGRVRCRLCPHECEIAPGAWGRCRVRTNIDGAGAIPLAGRLTSVAIDPIEKKPLYHYRPGSSILSVGFFGCNFHCPFCQNHAISQTNRGAARDLEPGQLVETAAARGSIGIAYTYSEPLVHLEYVLECARLARARGLANVLVSNGFVNSGPAEELLGLLDAANIDLKAWDEDFYRREVGGDRDDVCRFVRQAAGRIHLEVTTLVIPTKNDDPAQIEAMAAFLAAADPNIPYHLSCYTPTYRYAIPPTPIETVRRLAAVARAHLRFVYLGNVGLEETNTLCPRCGALVVRRTGYRVAVVGLRDGRCSSCGAPLPFRI